MTRLICLAIARPGRTLAVLAAVTLLFAGGLARLDSQYGYRVLLGDDHPSVVRLDDMIATFGGGLPLTIAWECDAKAPCVRPSDDPGLRMADAITRELASSPFVRSVQGFANAPLLTPLPDGFAVRRLFENGVPSPDADALARLAAEDPIWRDQFISRDGSVAAIVVQPRDTQGATDVGVVDAIFATLEPYERDGMKFHLVGDAVATVVSGRALAESTARLVPFTVIVIALIVLLFVRSWRATLLCLASLGIAMIWTFGLLGWLGWPQDGILEVLAPLVLTIGVCDAIHLLASYSERVAANRAGTVAERRLAMDQAATDVAGPCRLTTITTAAAFLSFLTSDLDTFVRFGSISAFAASACFVVTFSLLPALGPWLKLDRGHAAQRAATWRAAFEAANRVAMSRSRTLLVAATIVFTFFAIGWTRLEVDTNWYESWGPRSDVVQWLHFVESRLGPSESLELSITLPHTTQLASPETLARVVELSDRIDSLDGLGDAKSIVEPLARLHRLVRDNDPAFERIGDDLSTNAELLELLEFEGVDLVSPWLTLDRRQLRVSIGAHEQPYQERRRTLRATAEHVARIAPADWRVELTGESTIGFEWIRDVQATQLRSFPTALLLALVLVTLFFRSLRIACAALVPTLLPIVVTLGGMGWLGMSLDVGRAMLAAVILGIAIDDAIHFLHRLDAEQRVQREGAIERALVGVGPALATTSIALSLGFLTFMASAWQTISSFGFFMSLAIVGALIATLFVLPALLYASGQHPDERDHARRR